MRELFSEDIPSIEHFLNSACRVTQFDADIIKVSEFKERYIMFCEANRLFTMIVTRSLMARYGV